MSPSEKRAKSLLYLDNVSVSFDGFKALNSLSFFIEPGELRAVIGPNGAGKTTMMDIITGKTRPDTGEVFFADTIDLTRKDEADIAQLLAMGFMDHGALPAFAYGAPPNGSTRLRPLSCERSSSCCR